MVGRPSMGIFVGSLDGKENRRILADQSGVVFAPGDRAGYILFSRENTLMALPFDAASAEAAGELLLPSGIQHTPTQWSRDGKFIVFSQQDRPESLWVLPLEAAAPERKPVLFLKTGFNTMLGQISPDGHWMAFYDTGTPVALFDTHTVSASEGGRPVYQFDVTADGKRFLIVTDSDTGAAPALTVVANWQAGLKK